MIFEHPTKNDDCQFWKLNHPKIMFSFISNLFHKSAPGNYFSYRI